MAGESGVFRADVSVSDPDVIRSVLVYRGEEENPNFKKLVEGDGRSSLDFIVLDTLSFSEDKLPRDELYNIRVVDERDDVVEKIYSVMVVDPGKAEALLEWSGPETVFSKGFWNSGEYELWLLSRSTRIL